MGKIHIAKEIRAYSTHKRTLCGVEENQIYGQKRVRLQEYGNVAHRLKDECRRCRELYEKQFDATDEVWYFVDLVLEGRQGAARGASIEPLLVVASWGIG